MPADLPPEVHVRAPGKINLALAVGPAGPDGYHEIATVFQAVSLFEEIRATPSDRITVNFAGNIDTGELGGSDDTLVHRAARLVAAELTEIDRKRLHLRPGHAPGAHFEVTKNVPIAGGMGGGSADAAATLLACDALWGLDLSKERLLELAGQLGADVPFAMLGGTQLGAGRGDVLTPVLTSGQFHWVLVFAPFGLSTPEVYRRLDELRPVAPNAIVAPDVLAALRAGSADDLGVAMHNDLGHAALDLAPQLLDVVAIASDLESRWLVSGSGPTLAFLNDDETAAQLLAAHLRANGQNAVAVHGPVPGARFVPDV